VHDAMTRDTPGASRASTERVHPGVAMVIGRKQSGRWRQVRIERMIEPIRLFNIIGAAGCMPWRSPTGLVFHQRGLIGTAGGLLVTALQKKQYILPSGYGYLNTYGWSSLSGRGKSRGQREPLCAQEKTHSSLLPHFCRVID
jgi:hypothetical protein